MSAPTSPSASPTHGGATSSRLDLQRQLGLWSAVAIVVGTTIGSGIFRTPAGVTDRLPGPLPVFSIWLVGGLLAMSGALAMAEIAGAYPNTGGIFHFILKAWGRLPAFVFGWAQLSLIRAASLGAIAVTFAEYFLRVLGYDPGIAPYDGWANIVAAGAIILTGAFNYVGVRSGAIVQNLTTAAKFAGLLFIEAE